MKNPAYVARRELRSAAWCRREAAKQPKGSRLRAAEVHEARNRIKEARAARFYGLAQIDNHAAE